MLKHQNFAPYFQRFRTFIGQSTQPMSTARLLCSTLSEKSSTESVYTGYAKPYVLFRLLYCLISSFVCRWRNKLPAPALLEALGL